MTPRFTNSAPVVPAAANTQPVGLTPSFEASAGVTTVRHHAHVALMFVLLVALFQGVIYLVLLPPWQHYDEPSHFEYAWLLANHGHIASIYDNDPVMRREVASSMLEHQFFWNLPKPDLFSTDAAPSIGLPELEHPPIYYLLVSLPLRFARHLDVTSQLYIARSVSLLLFVLTIAVITGTMRDLVGPQHALYWAVPFVATCIPSIADLMTSVNNDVGAIFIFSLFLWGAVRLLCRGYTWRRGLWLVTTAGVAVFVKNTAAVALLLMPFVGFLALSQYYHWRPRWTIGILAGLVLVGLMTMFQSGDAAYWYRWSAGPSQTRGTRATINDTFAVMIEALPNNPTRYLLNPILDRDVAQVAGQAVTVGGWVWANVPTVVSAPGLVVSNRGTTELRHLTHPMTVTTTPTFIAWTTIVSPTADKVYYAFSGHLLTEGGATQLFIKNPILVKGAFSSTDTPLFSDATASQGSWTGHPFINLVRNAGTQSSWLRLRPWVERTLFKSLHRSPAHILDALFDIQYTWPYLGGTVGPALFSEFFSSFAWGHVRLQGPIWEIVACIISILALLGCFSWVIRKRTAPLPSRGSALFAIATAGLLIWLLALVWPLPYRWSRVLVPSARYTFPALLPTVLVVVGGWQALWPRRLRVLALCLLLLAVVVLDAAAVATIWSFYHSLPIT